MQLGWLERLCQNVGVHHLTQRRSRAPSQRAVQDRPSSTALERVTSLPCWLKLSRLGSPLESHTRSSFSDSLRGNHSTISSWWPTILSAARSWPSRSSAIWC